MDAMFDKTNSNYIWNEDSWVWANITDTPFWDDGHTPPTIMNTTDTHGLDSISDRQIELDKDPFRGHKGKVLLIVGLVLSLVIYVENSLTIYVIRSTSSLQTMQNKYVLSLAYADLLVGMALIELFCVKHFGWNCQFTIAMLHSSLEVSSFNMMAIAVDRYVFIARPFLHMRKFTSRLTIGFLLLQWAIGLTYGFLPTFLFGLGKDKGCHPFFSLHHKLITCLQLVQYGLIVLITGILYGLIARIAKEKGDQRRRRRRRRANNHNHNHNQHYVIKTLENCRTPSVAADDDGGGGDVVNGHCCDGGIGRSRGEEALGGSLGKKNATFCKCHCFGKLFSCCGNKRDGGKPGFSDSPGIPDGVWRTDRAGSTGLNNNKNKLNNNPNNNNNNINNNNNNSNNNKINKSGILHRHGKPISIIGPGDFDLHNYVFGDLIENKIETSITSTETLSICQGIEIAKAHWTTPRSNAMSSSLEDDEQSKSLSPENTELPKSPFPEISQPPKSISPESTANTKSTSPEISQPSKSLSPESTANTKSTSPEISQPLKSISPESTEHSDDCSSTPPKNVDDPISASTSQETTTKHKPVHQPIRTQIPDNIPNPNPDGLHSLRWLKQMVTVYGVFVVCWSPSQMAAFLYLVGVSNQDPIYFLSWLGLANSAFNFYIYAFVNPQFRKALRKKLRSKSWIPALLCMGWCCRVRTHK